MVPVFSRATSSSGPRAPFRHRRILIIQKSVCLNPGRHNGPNGERGGPGQSKSVQSPACPRAQSKISRLGQMQFSPAASGEFGWKKDVSSGGRCADPGPVSTVLYRGRNKAAQLATLPRDVSTGPDLCLRWSRHRADVRESREERMEREGGRDEGGRLSEMNPLPPPLLVLPPPQSWRRDESVTGKYPCRAQSVGQPLRLLSPSRLEPRASAC